MKQFLIRRATSKVQYLISIAVVVVISLVGLSLYSFIGYRVVAFMLLVAVSILAMFLDIRPVLVAACLSALCWDLLFIPPRFTITVGTPEDRLLLLMYFIIALINAVLTHKIRAMERELKEKEEKEMSVKYYNTLINSLSHELRTPITTILGSTDALQSETRLSEQHKSELINEISEASLRLNQQVENLLNMSRIEAGVFSVKRDWCDLHDLLYSTLKRLDKQLTNYRVQVDAPVLPLVKLDYVLMEQVIYNLVLNATQHTPPETVITLQASYEDGNAVIIIADNGFGFPVSDIGNVFEKFYRVQGSATGGTGLGLSIVKGFVEAHNGKVSLENLPIRGSKFTITIPTEADFLTNVNQHE